MMIYVSNFHDWQDYSQEQALIITKYNKIYPQPGKKEKQNGDITPVKKEIKLVQYRKIQPLLHKPI